TIGELSVTMLIQLTHNLKFLISCLCGFAAYLAVSLGLTDDLLRMWEPEAKPHAWIRKPQSGKPEAFRKRSGKAAESNRSLTANAVLNPLHRCFPKVTDGCFCVS